MQVQQQITKIYENKSAKITGSFAMLKIRTARLQPYFLRIFSYLVAHHAIHRNPQQVHARFPVPVFYRKENNGHSDC